ncbi:uncharacterized protein LOC107407544 isoform X2 [Ziziphus jujuba]|uniref:Uncharacterized protein LOC107407544 isoform X2 n=1 Tax=Ziziphus jujuba TaxID=326968 RepID=A0A6P3YZK2_ZIZJJ|nr:uncharacterized protein LOC107407544 isoform X2 [Ziziphus jujuba]
MALAFKPIIPHTTTRASLRSSPLGFCSSSPNPTHPVLFHHFPHTLRPRIRRIAHGVSASKSNVTTTLSDVEQHRQLKANDNGSTPTSTSNTAWSEFARNVSGEWDGYGAEFSNEGNPIELPETVVPEAYREWEVKLFDWQTQCPTLADPEGSALNYKLIKLLPTVGCEADAATRYSIDERNIGGLNDKVSAFAYQSSGCYVAVWPTENKGSYNLMELEHCLINPQDRESRVRVIQVIRLESMKMVLQSIKVFCEQWYGPFRNGDQLGGCAIRDSAFASTAALEASEVVGIWQGPNAVANFDASQNSLQELVDDNMQKSVRDGLDLVLLPKQLWCSLKESNDGGTCSEVGWLLNHGHAITSKCTFSSKTTLKEISVACETAASEGA